MKEILTPAFIKQKTEAMDQVLRARVELVLSLILFSSIKTFKMEDTFSEYKQQNEMGQNKVTYTECRVNNQITIHFGQTGSDHDNVFDVWIQPHGPYYYQVDPKLYPILRLRTDPKVKMGDLQVNIRYRTKRFTFIGKIDQVLTEVLIRLGKHDFTHELDEVKLDYSTRRYKDTLTLTILPKVSFKPGYIHKFVPGANHVRNTLNLLTRVERLYQECE